MTTFSGPPSSAIRNRPISPQLHHVLATAGIAHIEITSGGQDALGEGNRRTGSKRHDRGRAAGRCVVIACHGLTLHGGPGTHFDASATLPCDQQLTVIDNGTQFRDWACVDLQSDGKSDGYVFCELSRAGPLTHLEPDSMKGNRNADG